MLARTGQAKPLPHPANTNQSPAATAWILLAPWQTRAELEPAVGGTASWSQDLFMERGGEHRAPFNWSTAGEKGIFSALFILAAELLGIY